MTTPPPDNRLKVDLRLWNIMQNICVAGLALKNAHEAVFRNSRHATTADQKTELMVARDTGGKPWFDLSNALSEVKPPARAEVRGENILVNSFPDISSRTNVKVALYVLVSNINSAGKNRGLVRGSKVTRTDDGKATYRGAIMQPALKNATAALREWNVYIAEIKANTETAKLFNRLRTPGYVPGSLQKPLALPAPSVRSGPPAPSGS